jgi:hypothetical protein
LSASLFRLSLRVAMRIQNLASKLKMFSATSRDSCRAGWQR